MQLQRKVSKNTLPRLLGTGFDSDGPTQKPLRVLLLSQYFPPEVGATQFRMQSFAEHLSDRGHDVTVVAEVPNHPHGVIPDEYRGILYEDDQSNPYRVLRVWVKANREKTQTTRLAFYVSYMALAIAVAPIAGPCDVVVATTPPLFTGVAGATIARLRRAPFVLDVRDLWPAAAISLGQISNGGMLRVAETVERWLYREADAVVAVTRPFCDHIDALRRRPPRTIFLPNGTVEDFLHDPDQIPREDIGLPPDRFLVTFAGTHGIAQGLPAVLDAAQELAAEADVLFVGDGPVKDDLVASASGRSLTNVHFHPEVPFHAISRILAASDALVVPLSSHETFDQFVPSKLLDFMAVGRPVILAASGESARIVESAKAGLVVEPENPNSLAEAVRKLRSSPAVAAEMGENGRRYARRYLRREQASRLERVLVDVVERSNRAA